MIDTEHGVEILSLLDFDPSVPCVYPECLYTAEWSVLWSCGCFLDYCTAHKDELVRLSLLREIDCWDVHSQDGVTPRSITPIDK